MTANTRFIGLGILASLTALVARLRRSRSGSDRFFKDQHFHYETLRVVAHTPYGGAEIGEVFSIVGKIREGNTEDWYREWYAMAKFVEQKADDIDDPRGKGLALMRAQNYYRNSEFYLSPTDPRRDDTFANSARTYRDSLNQLGVEFHEFPVPYDGAQLNAIYYPSRADGADDRPLLIAHGGYDSTLEELYFWFVAPALERGYSILTFSGPGQDSVIRQHGIPFTHEWERPTTAVIDAHLSHHDQPERFVLLGLSLGGLLAPRAAAFEKRIDGVVAIDAMYSFQDTLFTNVPAPARPIVRWLYDNDHARALNLVVKLKARVDVGAAWGVSNGQWVMNFQGHGEIFNAFEPYHLEGIAELIQSDVLLLWGEDDHFVDDDQLTRMQAGLENARSVTTKSYSAYEGGKEHAQTGILTSVHADIFDWIHQRFLLTESS